MRSCRALATVPALLIWSTPLLHAQTEVVLPREASCPDCRIEWEPVVTLGSLSDPTGFSMFARLVQDSRGRYYVYPSVGGAEILVYDSAGQFLRLVGRPGSGPREFERIQRVVVADGDTLHVYHGLRHTVLDPDYEFVRSGPMPTVVNAVLLAGVSRSVILGEIPTRTSVGQPLHLLNDRDSLVLSFGSLRPVRDPRYALAAAYGFAGSGDDHLWIIAHNRYAFERWTIDGERVQGFTRDVDWFPEWDLLDYHRDQPRMAWVHEDPAGRVWLGFVLSSGGPRRGPAVRRERPVVPTEALDRLYMRLEVIDVANARVLVSTPGTSDVLLGFIGPDRAYSRREDAVGNLVLDIWRVQLRTR